MPKINPTPICGGETLPSVTLTQVRLGIGYVGLTEQKILFYFMNLTKLKLNLFLLEKKQYY